MASGGWTNIFLQMLVGVPPIPVVGEAWLDGWWTQIELEKFGWDMTVSTNPKNKPTGIGTVVGGAVAAAGGAIAGNIAGLGGAAGIAAAATAAAIASAALAEDDRLNVVNAGKLKFSKRFDIASSTLHTVVDNNLPVISALITVIHIKPDGATLHQPGFTLLATDGRLETVNVDMERGDKGVEVVEEFELEFKSIVITYSKRLGANNIPMAPFIHDFPEESDA